MNERLIAAADYRCGIEGQYHARKGFKALRGMSNSAKRNVPFHRLRGKRQTGSHLKLLGACQGAIDGRKRTFTRSKLQAAPRSGKER